MENGLIVVQTLNKICTLAQNIVLSRKGARLIKQGDLKLLAMKIDEAIRLAKGNEYEAIFISGNGKLNL